MLARMAKNLRLEENTGSTLQKKTFDKFFVLGNFGKFQIKKTSAKLTYLGGGRKTSDATLGSMSGGNLTQTDSKSLHVKKNMAGRES